MDRGDVCFYVAAVGSDTVDAVGIKEANRLAMDSAITEVLKLLESRNPGKMIGKEILVDGNDHYRFDIAEFETGGKIEIAEHIRGDSRFKVIGAASILAKVTRDTLMESLALLYPQYGFEKHKGYGTALHRNVLSEFGVLEIHRKTYSPIKHLILRAKKI
jgi:ribonuclease HII